jgi:hypothetical protein
MMDSSPTGWLYDEPATLAGALQRGLGRGARRAAGPEAVFACVKRDYRWDWMVDERAVYLARLVRDLAMPVPPLLTLLREHPADNDDNTFDNTLEVLVALGRSGDRSAVDGLFQYVRDGPRWTEVLQTTAEELPREMWNDLLPVARARLGHHPGPDTVVWRGRPWLATPPVHPMVWTAYVVLAEHGDATDLPALFAGWDWLDRRGHDRCGYDDLAAGLARIGGPAARAAVPRLHRAWSGPHTYERAAYLRAATALDPDAAHRLLVEGLWDCESNVRRFAAEHAPLDDMTRDQLRCLRDDPVETPEVRAIAARRLV